MQNLVKVLSIACNAVAENSEDAAKSIEHDAKPVAEAVQEEGSNVKQAGACP